MGWGGGWGGDGTFKYCMSRVQTVPALLFIFAFWKTTTQPALIMYCFYFTFFSIFTSFFPPLTLIFMFDPLQCLTTRVDHIFSS